MRHQLRWLEVKQYIVLLYLSNKSHRLHPISVRKFGVLLTEVRTTAILFRTKWVKNSQITSEGQNEVSDYILVTLLFSMQTAPLLAASWPDENF